jgi:hypothetical protein
MLLHKEVREPKLPVTGTRQSWNLIEVMLVRSVLPGARMKAVAHRFVSVEKNS